jgi:hypothetical protein
MSHEAICVHFFQQWQSAVSKCGWLGWTPRLNWEWPPETLINLAPRSGVAMPAWGSPCVWRPAKLLVLLMGPWVHSDFFPTFRTRLSARPTLLTQACSIGALVVGKGLLCVSASRDTEEVAAQSAPYCVLRIDQWRWRLQSQKPRLQAGGGGRRGRRWRLQGSKPRLQAG